MSRTHRLWPTVQLEEPRSFSISQVCPTTCPSTARTDGTVGRSRLVEPKNDAIDPCQRRPVRCRGLSGILPAPSADKRKPLDDTALADDLADVALVERVQPELALRRDAVLEEEGE